MPNRVEAAFVVIEEAFVDEDEVADMTGYILI